MGVEVAAAVSVLLVFSLLLIDFAAAALAFCVLRATRGRGRRSSSSSSARRKAAYSRGLGGGGGGAREPALLRRRWLQSPLGCRSEDGFGLWRRW